MRIENVCRGVTVSCEDQQGILGIPAKVTITDPDGNTFAVIIVKDELQKGLDGGLYHTAIFEQVTT